MRNIRPFRAWTMGFAVLASLVAVSIHFVPRIKRRLPSANDVANVRSTNPTVHASVSRRTPIAASARPRVKKAPPSVAHRVDKTKKSAEEFTLGPDAGGENGEDPRARANYFYGQRAYPFERTPAGALQASREQLETMITRQRELGILPQELPRTQTQTQTLAPSQESTNFPGPSTWTNIGPRPVTNSAGSPNFGNPAATGRVTAIAVDPTPSLTPTVYLGAATGGVWKSTDGGTTWINIFDQNKSLAIGGIGIAPSAPSTIYVGTGELNFSQDSYYGAGIYKSTDGGAHWTQQCGPAGVFCNPVGNFPFQGGGFIVGTIAVNPTDPTIALAAVRKPGDATGSGIYRTTDGGTTWTQIPSASGAAGNSIIWNPTNNTVVYATLGQAGNSALFGVYKSTDSGVTFTRLTGSAPGLPTASLGRHEMTVAPSNGSVIYVTIDNNNTDGLLALVKSTDGGANWTSILPSSLPSLPNFCNGQCWYDMALAVNPTDPNNLIVGGSAFTNNSSTVFRTLDGGSTWVDITSGSTAVRPHVDTHALTYANLTGGNFRLYTGNDGGVWFTDNAATLTPPVTWQTANNANLVITQFYPGDAVHPSDENVGFGGTQDNGTERWLGGLAWDHVTCGDGAWAAVDPNIPTTVYANCQNIAILRSAFDGSAGTFSSITNEVGASSDRSLFIPPFVHDPAISGRLYFGTFRVWQTADFGNSWTAITGDLTAGSGADITSVSVSPANSSVVYATTSDGRVWRTTNANLGSSSTWTNLTKAPLPGRYATEVRTSKTNADIAFLSYSGFNGFSGDVVGHIFKTTDGGATWLDISGLAAGALPNTPVNDIAVDHIGAPLNFDAMFIATDVGVFECPDPLAVPACTTWSPVSTGLPAVPVTALVLRENSQTLRAATHGRGVWVLQVPGINQTGRLLLTSISPSSAATGAASFTMTLDGNDFGSPSGTPVVLVDGAVVAGLTVNTFTANQISATIPVSVMATAGVHLISVSQPGHANTPSNPTSSLTFSVTAPAPTITLLSPSSAALNAASFPLTVTGTNFICGATPSVVRFRSTPLTPTACSSTSLTVTVPANLLTISGGASVRVFSAGPGGGLSNTLTFQVIAPPPVNDNFASALIVNTVPYTDTQQTGGATTEVGEPVPAPACTTGEAAATHSVWYKYTPSINGLANFTTTGESIDGVLQVVTGTGLGALTPVLNGCDDEFAGVPENITVAVSAGTTYYIMVSDWAGLGGTSVLNMVGGPSPLQGFDVSGPTAPVVVAAGGTAHFTITITPQAGGFFGAVTFSATGLPGFSSASFSPPSVTPGASPATTDMAITTTVRSGFVPTSPPPQLLPSPNVMLALLAAMMTLALVTMRSSRRRSPALLLVGAVMILATGLFAGCSKGSSGGGGGGGATGTPVGTYPITVTATSGSQSKTAVVTLTVQ
jgi:photosystem II stability/assembly factor-like uncharacterized protein